MVHRYNNQLDKINEICDFYESPQSATPDGQTKAFDLLN